MENKEISMEMTPHEKFEAVANLKKQLENTYMMLGQVLSDIKRKGSFKLKGHKTFKEFIEAEYNMSSAAATKLINNYELFVEELDLDEETVKEIGHDRMNMVKSFVDKAENYAEKEEWLETAQTLNAADLKDKIKEIRANEKDSKKSFKDVMIEQFLETMVTYFNCSRKELDFKLALYFQDADLEDIKVMIKKRQRRFETDTEQGGMPQ
ncbi:MAG: hypothetical protein P9L91_02775 [Candidatus Zophobacter franzmannii]|jgi:hypothetical protein|nr:hypothetical protein [Candidatus Zophobacter franzmannii]